MTVRADPKLSASGCVQDAPQQAPGEAAADSDLHPQPSITPSTAQDSDDAGTAARHDIDRSSTAPEAATAATSACPSDCVDWLRNRLELLCPPAASAARNGAASPAEFVAAVFDPLRHTPTFADFLASTDAAPTLFAYLDSSHALRLGAAVPPAGDFLSLMYFLRAPGCEEVQWSARTIFNRVQVGVVKDRDPLEALQRLMGSVFVPALLRNTAWPEAIRKDFSAAVRNSFHPAYC